MAGRSGYSINRSRGQSGRLYIESADCQSKLFNHSSGFTVKSIAKTFGIQRQLFDLSSGFWFRAKGIEDLHRTQNDEEPVFIRMILVKQ